MLGQSQHAAKYWVSESTPPMQMPHNPKFPASVCIWAGCYHRCPDRASEDHQGRASLEFRARNRIARLRAVHDMMVHAGIGSGPAKLGGTDPLFGSFALCRSWGDLWARCRRYNLFFFAQLVSTSFRHYERALIYVSNMLRRLVLISEGRVFRNHSQSAKLGPKPPSDLQKFSSSATVARQLLTPTLRSSALSQVLPSEVEAKLLKLSCRVGN